MTRSLPFAAALVLFAASTASAQIVYMMPQAATGTSMSTGLNPLQFINGGYAGFYPWGRYGFGTTPYESFARGDAAIIRSLGEYEYLNSEANKNNQEAYKQFLENDRQRVEVYFAKKQLWDSWRATQRRPRPSQEQVARWADDLRPERLSDAQLDPTSGKILWPARLLAPEFTVARDRLNALYASRMHGNVQPRFASDVKEAVNDLRVQVLNQIDAIPPMEYVAIDKFLDSLHYESFFLPDKEVALR
ncbi:MAG: hypothetical protein K1X74_23035 [Pirellulales bacterium]|nr:hypothetical protein [Pirellulales bacterium]